MVAANAHSGFYVTARTFAPEAEEYASTAPIKLVDSATLIASIKRSKAGAVLSETYKRRYLGHVGNGAGPATRDVTAVAAVTRAHPS